MRIICYNLCCLEQRSGSGGSSAPTKIIKIIEDQGMLYILYYIFEPNLNKTSDGNFNKIEKIRLRTGHGHGGGGGGGGHGGGHDEPQTIKIVRVSSKY